MKNNILLKTNLLVSVILLVGFALIATLSYRANYNASLVKIKQVSSLASEGIYYRLSTMLTKPVNISQTMAHDSLLIKLLEEEGSRYQEAGYQETIRKYLDTYKNKYAYDSVFLVSASTNNYYNFNGLDRNLVRGEDENVWYYNFLQSGEEYSLNIDNDEVAGAANKITLFVNCRIRDASGQLSLLFFSICHIPLKLIYRFVSISNGIDIHFTTPPPIGQFSIANFLCK